MKKKWQEVRNCNFAIKVIFRNASIVFRLYDRDDRCLKSIVREELVSDKQFCKCLDEMYRWAYVHCGNNYEYIYVHNPYWPECKNIKVG